MQPLNVAITKMIKVYEDPAIDLPKEVLTLSGVANNILHGFNEGEAIFLFPDKNKDIYKLLRSHIVDGSSLVFSRHKKT